MTPDPVLTKLIKAALPPGVDPGPAAEIVIATLEGMDQTLTHHPSVLASALKAYRDRIPGIGVTTITTHKKRILIGKRKGSHGAGYLHNPGGRVHFGEELYQAAEREAKEETGLRICVHHHSPFDWIMVSNNVYRKDDAHFVTFWYHAYVMDAPEDGWPTLTNTEPEKNEFWEWLTLEELKARIPTPDRLAMEEGRPTDYAQWIPLKFLYLNREKLGL